MSKLSLKLARPHPRKSYRLGKHSIGLSFKEYELDETEQAELKGKGAKHWITVKGEEVKKPVKPAKRKEK